MPSEASSLFCSSSLARWILEWGLCMQFLKHFALSLSFIRFWFHRTYYPLYIYIYNHLLLHICIPLFFCLLYLYTYLHLSIPPHKNIFSYVRKERSKRRDFWDGPIIVSSPLILTTCLSFLPLTSKAYKLYCKSNNRSPLFPQPASVRLLFFLYVLTFCSILLMCSHLSFALIPWHGSTLNEPRTSLKRDISALST